MNDLRRTLKEEFKLTDQGEAKSFLGIKIERTEDSMKISQTHYLEKLLKKFSMEDCKPISTPMETKLNTENGEATNKPYRELIGCLMYVMIQTRPDLSVAVNLFSRYQSQPTDSLYIQLKRVLRYVKGTTDFGLIYKKGKEVSPLRGFVDADFANDINDRKSTSGYLFQIYGSTVCWSTRKQSTVAISSTEAEYLALASAIQEAMWLKGLLVEMCVIGADEQIVLYEDNQSCIKIAEEPRKHQRLKHLDTKYNFINESIANNEIKLEYVPSENQLADILTKPLSASTFMRLKKLIGVNEY
ncbi:unnamed protein product [Macrosiphum euphorbiae]|nr:unnamed protein product [Macrosiphum euphorbiae]